MNKYHGTHVIITVLFLWAIFFCLFCSAFYSKSEEVHFSLNNFLFIVLSFQFSWLLCVVSYLFNMILILCIYFYVCKIRNNWQWDLKILFWYLCFATIVGTHLTESYSELLIANPLCCIYLYERCRKLAFAWVYIGYCGKKPMPFLSNKSLSMLNFIEIGATVEPL